MLCGTPNDLLTETGKDHIIAWAEFNYDKPHPLLLVSLRGSKVTFRMMAAKECSSLTGASVAGGGTSSVLTAAVKDSAGGSNSNSPQVSKKV